MWAAGGQRAAERPVDDHSAERVVHGLPTRPEGRAPVRRTRPQIHGGGPRSQLHPPPAARDGPAAACRPVCSALACSTRCTTVFPSSTGAASSPCASCRTDNSRPSRSTVTAPSNALRTVTSAPRSRYLWGVNSYSSSKGSFNCNSHPTRSRRVCLRVIAAETARQEVTTVSDTHSNQRLRRKHDGTMPRCVLV